MKRRFAVLAVVCGVWSLAAAPAGKIAGMWDATITVADHAIPFRIGFSGSGTAVKGWFYNGKAKEVSNSGSFEDGNLVLNFDSYASVLKARVEGGVLDGQYTQRGKSLPVHATRSSGELLYKERGPDIHGIWVLENVGSKKKDEKAWQLIVQQEGPDVLASILRIDGDTGALTGGYRDGRFVLSHFSGARPSEIFLTPQKDGTLSVELIGQHHAGDLIAYRPTAAKEKGLPEPSDASRHTGVKDPLKPLAFSFPDLNGRVVSNTDEQFRDKVVLVNITGSWCPNCHDEAPFLAEVYNKFHSRGLEIVALSFEEPEQLENPTRLRAFIREYGIRYTVLLGGSTDSAKDKLTNALDWDSWPTTFFVGRDGLVRRVHTGFPGPGSGELYTKAKQEFVETVEQLLGERQVSSR